MVEPSWRLNERDVARSFSQHPAVEDDLDGIFDYIASDNLEAADRVIDAIGRAVAFIERSPEVAPLYPIDDPKLNGILRKKVVISFRRYLVFYTVTEEEILILYVHAGSLPTVASASCRGASDSVGCRIYAG